MIAKALLATLAITNTALAEDNYVYPPASPQRADIAGIRIEWQLQHQRIVDAVRKQQPDVVFLGDSITAGWGDLFKEKYGELNAYNAGISGDRTQNILWRIENGVLETKPRVVVLLIGINNILFGYTPEQTVDGQKAILKKIKETSPDTKILLMGVLPHGELATHPNRAKVTALNEMLAKEGDNKTVFFVNLFDQFLQPDGTLTREVAPDFLHLGKQGYEIWYTGIKEPLQQLLQTPKTNS